MLRDLPDGWIVGRVRDTLGSMINIDKKTLREQLIKKRSGLSPEFVLQKSQGVMNLLRAIAQWKDVQEVLVYWPIKGEVDIRPLVSELWQRGCRVLLPRCRPDAFGQMDIACASCEEDLTPGPFSIMEPDEKNCPAVSNCSPDMALIPGVCFDRRGYRLGFGGGYYDRLLASDYMRETLTIGLGYDFQFVDKLPVQPWDMPVNIVCTEEELWHL
jgi:5-formyltetrahydrofolate cyclo-ligase